MGEYQRLTMTEASIKEKYLNFIDESVKNDAVLDFNGDDLDSVSTLIKLFDELKNLDFVPEMGEDGKEISTEAFKKAYNKKREEFARLCSKIENLWYLTDTNLRIIILKDCAISQNPFVQTFLKKHIRLESRYVNDEIIFKRIYKACFYDKYNIPVDIMNGVLRKFVDKEGLRIGDENTFLAMLRLTTYFEKYMELAKDPNSHLSEEMILNNLTINGDINGSGRFVDKYKLRRVLTFVHPSIAMSRINFYNYYEANKDSFGEGLGAINTKEGTEKDRQYLAYLMLDNRQFFLGIGSEWQKAKKDIKYSDNPAKEGVSLYDLNNVLNDSKIFKYTTPSQTVRYLSGFQDIAFRSEFGDTTEYDRHFINVVLKEARNRKDLNIEEKYKYIENEDALSSKDKEKGGFFKLGRPQIKPSIDENKIKEYIDVCVSRGMDYEGVLDVERTSNNEKLADIRYYSFNYLDHKLLVPLGQINSTMIALNSTKPLSDLASEMDKNNTRFADMIKDGTAHEYPHSLHNELYSPNQMIVFAELLKRVYEKSDSINYAQFFEEEGLSIYALAGRITNVLPFRALTKASEYIRFVCEQVGISYTNEKRYTGKVESFTVSSEKYTKRREKDKEDKESGEIDNE